MANLDGSRSHGGRWDVLAGAILRDDPARFSRTYRLLLSAARAEGIGTGGLADFLGIEHGGELTLLGQEELDVSALEAELREQIARRPADSGWPEPETERILLAAARVGQHVFAQQVLANCGSRCVFCGLSPALFGARRMLLAGHIKPWKDTPPVNASIPAMAWLPAQPTTSRSTPGCCQSTADCVSTSPVPWPTPSRTTHWPGSTTGTRRWVRYCSCHPAPRSRPAILDWHRQRIFIT